MSECGTKVSLNDIEDRTYLFYDNPKYKKLAKSLVEQGFNPLFNGRQRLSFDLDDFVLKIPRGADGENANLNEVENYQASLDIKNRFHGKLAPCSLLIIDEIPCVLMHRVYTPEDQENFEPEWAGFFDYSQGGFCPRTKEFLIYDYADEYLADQAA